MAGTIGERLRELRTGAGLTQEQLAQRIGVSGPTVSNYETGYSRLSADDLPRVAEALGVHPAEFFLSEQGGDPATDALVGTPAFSSPLGRELRVREFARTMLPAWQALSDEEQARLERAATPAVERLGEVLLSFGAELLRDERTG